MQLHDLPFAPSAGQNPVPGRSVAREIGLVDGGDEAADDDPDLDAEIRRTYCILFPPSPQLNS